MKGTASAVPFVLWVEGNAALGGEVLRENYRFTFESRRDG
jgi:hypothetical protein